MVIYKKPFSIETGYNDFILLLIYKKIPQLYPRFSPTSIFEGLLIESLSFVKGYPSCLQSPSSLALYPTLSMTCPQETLSQSPGSVHQTLIVTPQCPPPHNALLPMSPQAVSSAWNTLHSLISLAQCHFLLQCSFPHPCSEPVLHCYSRRRHILLAWLVIDC